MKKIVFTPLDNGNLPKGSEQDFDDIRMMVNFCDALMNINANHKPAYLIAIGTATFIDTKRMNILDFLLTFYEKDDTIYLFEFSNLKEALMDHYKYLTENELI